MLESAESITALGTLNLAEFAKKSAIANYVALRQTLRYIMSEAWTANTPFYATNATNGMRPESILNQIEHSTGEKFSVKYKEGEE